MKHDGEMRDEGGHDRLHTWNVLEQLRREAVEVLMAAVRRLDAIEVLERSLEPLARGRPAPLPEAVMPAGSLSVVLRQLLDGHPEGETVAHLTEELVSAGFRFPSRKRTAAAQVAATLAQLRRQGHARIERGVNPRAHRHKPARVAKPR